MKLPLQDLCMCYLCWLAGSFFQDSPGFCHLIWSLGRCHFLMGHSPINCCKLTNKPFTPHYSLPSSSSLLSRELFTNICCRYLFGLLFICFHPQTPP